MNIANSKILQQLQFCRDQKFTGKLSINNFQGDSITSMQGDCWSLIFSRGKLVGNIAGIHPLRSLHRQFNKQKCELSSSLEMEVSSAIQTPDFVYWLLEELPTKSMISREQILKITEKRLFEALFDILRCEILTAKASAQPLSFILESYKFKNNFIPIIPNRIEILWPEVTESIKNWQKRGLMDWSPHVAPQVTDFLNLKKISFNHQGQCIRSLSNGERTIWDIAEEVSADISVVGALVLKCYREEAMIFKTIHDFNWQAQQEIDATVRNFLSNIDTPKVQQLV